MRPNKEQQIIDQIIAVKKAARELEIALYGKPLNYAHTVKSKKAYNRKRKHKKQYEY